MKIKFNKQTKIILICTVLLIAFSVFYYFVIFLPNKEQQNITLNREITQEEIQKFIPVNYSAVSATPYNDIVIKKYELNGDTLYVFPLQPKDEQNIVSNNLLKILLLEYNKPLDNYHKVFEYPLLGNSFVGFYYDDIDDDNIEELFAESSTNYGGSGTDYNLQILKISNSDIKEIAQFSSNIPSGSQYYSDSKKIINASYIWGTNESHFGCHYINIKKYCYSGNTFSLCDEKRSKYKYNFGDYGYEKCFPFPDNFNEFLNNESYSL